MIWSMIWFFCGMLCGATVVGLLMLYALAGGFDRYPPRRHFGTKR